MNCIIKVESKCMHVKYIIYVIPTYNRSVEFLILDLMTFMDWC